MDKYNKLYEIAGDLRRDIVKMFYPVKLGHLTPALSCLDILVALYFGQVLNLEGDKRDRFILSKGHAAAALYAVLCRAGYIPKSELNLFHKKESILGGHPGRNIPGVELATGSLGHGLAYATGIAKSAKIDNLDFNVYVLLGDGECQEGSVWEGMLFASQHCLDNLIVIIDRNKLQATNTINNIIEIEPFKEKWLSFNWNVLEANGHIFSEIVTALQKAKNIKNKRPTVILADTIKGKGISFMENNVVWHSSVPKDEHSWEKICAELNMDFRELSDDEK